MVQNDYIRIVDSSAEREMNKLYLYYHTYNGMILPTPKVQMVCA